MELDLCAFRYVCVRGHELDSKEPVTRCPEPCGADLAHTLNGRTEDGYLSPDERLKRGGTL